MVLWPCAVCKRHTRLDEARCHHCRAPTSALRRTALAAAAVSAALAGLGFAPQRPEPEYGAPPLVRDLAQLIREGRCDEAIPELERLHELRPAPRVLLLLAECRRKVGDDAGSARDYAAFLAECDAGAGCTAAEREAARVALTEIPSTPRSSPPPAPSSEAKPSTEPRTAGPKSCGCAVVSDTPSGVLPLALATLALTRRRRKRKQR